MKTQDFEEMELVDGKYKAVFEYIGEGNSGDYDESDPDDVPLLRFSCYEKSGEEWNEVDDASYCTQFPTDTSRDILARALRVILNELKDAREGGSSGKKAMAMMSWLGVKDFQTEGVM